MGYILVSGRKPCPQTKEKYGPNHKQHLKSPCDLLTHLLHCRASCEGVCKKKKKKFFGGFFSHSPFSELTCWLRRKTSVALAFCLSATLTEKKLSFLFFVFFCLIRGVALYEDARQRPEVSRALSISGTSASRSNRLSVWRVELSASLPHKNHSWESFKYQKEGKYPT